jgi:hypothetical protein
MISLGRTRWTTCAALLGLQWTCGLGNAWGAEGSQSPTTVPSVVARQDFEVVDCLLPPQVRTVGGRTFATPRRPTHTTVSECRVRGGEWVAFDRANLQTALRVWLDTAQQGDADAQTTVGEIYERGLGVQPDYLKAAEWYQKAADQGSARALFNLGTLYEQGRGVEQDTLKALNLYRQAGGLTGDIGYEEAFQHEIEKVRADLQSVIAERDAEIEALQQQIDALKVDMASQANSSANAARQVATLERMVAKLRNDREVSEVKLANLPGCARPPCVREPTQPKPGPGSGAGSPAKPVELAGMKLGRYYALVIGNQNYQKIEPLQTPLNDARRTADLLEERYGFAVTVINDADDEAMLRAINRFWEVLKPEDNLLIYYAGHGSRFSEGGRSASWLPVNADPPPTDTFWVDNEKVTKHLERLKARRILVVADSCYAGLLSDDPDLRVLTRPEQVSLSYVQYKLPKRARLLISSGGDQPVLDQGGQGNSVFARAFLEVLEDNQAVLSAPSLFVQLRTRVKQAAARTNFRQEPEFKVIKSAGHEFGDFFFVPVAAAR